MLKFYIKVFRNSLFPNPLMDLVIFGMMIDTGPKFYSVPSYPPCMTLSHGLRTFMLTFYVKNLESHCFQTL